MGGNNRHGKERKASSFLSIFNVFKSRKSRDYEDTWDEAVNVRRISPSDEDKGYWIGEPDIDRKATAFIAKFYETRVSESEIQRQALQV